jgi:hypothetical protein
MWRRCVGWLSSFAIALALWALASSARANDYASTFNVLWELHWQQNGQLTAFRRWPQSANKATNKTISYSFNADADERNRVRTEQALQTIASTIGWRVQVLPEGDAKVQIEFVLRDFSGDEARQHVCFAKPSWRSGNLTKVRVELGTRWAFNCALHEIMHAFGIAGHPRGKTVLSYFNPNGQSLTELDEFILRAWYSEELSAGMSPLQVVRVMNQRWIREHVPTAHQAAARRAEDEWFAQTLAQLEAYARGQGEPPAVLYRSGGLTDEGRRLGLAQVQTLLGWTYLAAAGVRFDADKANDYLFWASESGHSGAASLYVKELAQGKLQVKARKRACEWARSVPREQRGGQAPVYDELLASKACSGAP